MTQGLGKLAGLVRQVAAPKIQDIREGTAFVTAAQVKELTGQPWTKFLKSGAANERMLPQPGAERAWPVLVVRDAAFAKKYPTAALDDLIARGAGGTRFADLGDARRLFGGLDDAAFDAARANGTIPVFRVHADGLKGLRQMVPESALPAAMTAKQGGSEAVAGAAQIASTGRVREFFSGPQGLARGTIIGGGLVFGGVALTGVHRRLDDDPAPDASPPAADAAPNTTAPAKPAPADTAPAAPSPAAPAPAAPAPAPAETRSPDQIAAERRAALGVKVAGVASGEVGKQAQFNAAGVITNDVAKYFATAGKAEPTSDYDWPGFFAAWVRQEAGDPISPGTDWLSIQDLIDHANKPGNGWKDSGAKPEVGDVAFFTTPANGDETGNNAGVVTRVDGTTIHVVRGWMLEGGHETVGTSTLSVGDPSILGFAGLTP